MNAVNQGTKAEEQAQPSNGNDAMQEAHSEEKPQSILAFEFSSPGAADFRVKMLNIAPGQLFAAAGYIRWMAEAEMTRIANQKPAIKLA